MDKNWMKFSGLIYVILILLLSTNLVNAVTVHFALVNDCHAVMETFGPRDPVTLEGPYGGYPRAVTTMKWLRDMYPDIICVHAGDIISGDFLSNMTRGLAMYDLWVAGGIQAFAIGNHEFEYGPYEFDSILGMMEVPLVCANLDAAGFPNLEAAMEPYRLFPVLGDEPGDTIWIAIVGLCTEETNLPGWPDPLVLTDFIAAIDTLTLPPEVDATVALTHLSYWDDESLGATIPWIDAILGGHDHSVLEEPIWAYSDSDSTPIVKAGSVVRCVGHLAMEYIPGEGLEYLYWEVIPMNEAIESDPAAREHLDLYRHFISAHSRVGVYPYNTVAFYAEEDIRGHPVAAEGTGYSDSPQGNLVSDAYRAATGADIAIEANGSLRMRIYHGPVTYADLFRAQPMGLDKESGLNAALVTFEVSGAQLRELIEISLYGADIDNSVFPEFSGMQLRYNPNGFPFTRVETDRWTVGGEPWNESETYLFCGTTLLIYGLQTFGYPISGVDTLEITSYEAIVDYCTDPGFVPSYQSEGRLINTATSIEESPITIDKFNITCYPNPFNSICNIKLDRPIDIKIKIPHIRIFNIHGKQVLKDVLKGSLYSWKPMQGLSSGLYLVRVNWGEHAISRKVFYLK